MRFIRPFLAALVALAALGLDAAEPVVDGPRARFDDPFIATLEGRWDIVRQIRGTEVRNTMTAAWVLNHQFPERCMLSRSTRAFARIAARRSANRSLAVMVLSS